MAEARVAVLGTGRMGAAVAARLATRHPVRVWNRTAARTDAAVRAGAVAAATPAEAVAGARLVVTTLADETALDAVLFGPDGAAAALAPGTTLAQLGTIGPDTVRRLASRLSDVDLVDAPMVGSVDAAAAGRLTLLAGGTDAALDTAAELLAPVGTVRRCGPLGAGSALKLVVNTALVAGLAALGDALSVGQTLGVPTDEVLGVLGAGPLAALLARGTSTTAAFPVAWAAKDLRLALDTGADTPVARAALGVLDGLADPTADLGTVLPLPRG
ncbi:NAD(P)-dependent oxidoreductase [Actinocatenispora rupis]|uniref:6-phosphogluconate dehydrogenase NADP-binding domain-containing protein n=1 Tax=Actinocatenispora rupis TaxID=519421 RepID=A0A8J3JE07_9ACTN|nr:NAD(P)-binding domain-containing protein [Actinocatenispora rupis]GID14218.1 hypothetical protein Aru02nite_51070 [Actinocatenispora rupis]